MSKGNRTLGKALRDSESLVVFIAEEPELADAVSRCCKDRGAEWTLRAIRLIKQSYASRERKKFAPVNATMFLLGLKEMTEAEIKELEDQWS